MGRLSLALSVFLLGGVSLFASPKHGSVEHGHATFHSIAGGMEIHSGNKTIINWDRFSIDAGEIARFCQSSSASAVLNRVIGSEQSLINGLLTSNGHVFLLNQNGILIGKDGVIDTAGFVASTLDLSNDQFLKGGDFFFKGEGKGSVINLGTIHTRGGDVFLIGYHVSNEGTIQTDGGIAGLGGGAEVFLAVEGEERLFIRKGIDSEEIGASNDGVIRAAEVEIKASGNPFALAIKHGGEIEATGVAHRNGRVLLVADSGKTEVAGLIQAESGTVHVLGDEVCLTEATSIDVSGDVGGEVLIGGDYRGSNPEIPNSQRTYVYKGAEVRADGHDGDGGKVIVWGTDRAHFCGDISAAALGEVGDGGFVEVSAKSNDYIFKGPVKASSVNGANGMLLLDPVDITVSNAPSNPPFPQGGANTYKPSGVSSANLDPADIVPILGVGNTNVLIDSTDMGAGSTGNGDVDFDDDVIWNGTGVLVVTAYRAINVNSGVTISATGGGGINFTAQGTLGGNYHGIEIDGTLSTDSGAIVLDGTSGTQSNSKGVLVDGTGVVSSDTGSIMITGLSRGGASNADGIRIEGLIQSTDSATIALDGTASNTVGTRSDGIDFVGGMLTTVDGDVMLTGTSFGPGTECGGIEIQLGSSITATGNASVTLMATGSPNGTTNSHGLKVSAQGAASFISVHDGDLSVTGEGKGTGSTSDGFDLGSPSGGSNFAYVESTGTGNIIIDGTATTSANSCVGIRVGDGNQIRSLGTGSITLTGQGGDGDAGYGVFIEDEGTVTSANSGTISITGTGGAGTSGDIYGVYLTDLNTAVTTNTGNLSITGTGGSGVGATHHVGVLFENQADISSTSGLVTLTGTGGNGTSLNHGLELTTAGTLSSPGGLVLNGTSSQGDNSIGVWVNNGVTLTTTGAGAISITGNATETGTDCHAVELAGAVDSQGSGNVTIAGTTTGTSSSGVLVDGSATGTIDATSGTVSITGTNNSVTGPNNVGIDLTSGAVLTTTCGSVTLNGSGGAGTDGYGVFLSGGSQVKVGGAGTLTIMGDSGTDSGNNYGVYLTGASTQATTYSGNLSLTGTSNSGAASNHNVGAFFDSNATIFSTSGVVSITGFGGNGTTNNHGLEITTASTITSPGGLVLAGTSKDGTDSDGVLLDSGVTALTSGTGAISITGTANGIDTGNHGVELDGNVNSTGSGNITIVGTSNGNGSFGVGVNGNITAAGGAISVSGTAQGGGSGGNGIDVNGATISAAGAGTLTLDGTGSISSTGSSVGVNLDGATVSSDSGLIEVTGTGGTGVNENQGILIGNSASVTSTTGVVIMDGTGNGTGENNHGIEITDSGLVRSINSGDINLRGATSTGNSFNSDGILMLTGADVRSEGSGNIIMTGIGQAPGINPPGELSGIDIINSTVQAIGTGAITCTGHCIANSDNSEGFKIQGAQITSTSGKITIEGNNSSSGFNSHGVHLETPFLASVTGVSTTGGDIEINGTSTMGNTTSRGILISDGTISTTGAGQIDMTGEVAVGTGTSGQNGVEIESSGAFTPVQISSVSGDINITGRSGGTSGSTFGVLLDNSAVVQSTGSGNVTLNGTSRATGGSGNVGVQVDGGATLSGSAGVVSIIGVGGMGTTLNHGVELVTSGTLSSPGGLVLDGTSSSGTNSRGVLLAPAITAQTAGAGNISITGVSSAGTGSPGVEIGGTVTTPGTGAITIQGTSSGSAATSPGVLVTSGTVSSTSGNITLTGTGNTGAALSEGISLNAASISATGGNIGLTGNGQDASGSPVGIAVAGGSSLSTTGLGTMTLTTLAGDFTDSGVAANTYDTQQGAFSLTSARAVLFSAGLTSTVTTTLGSASITANDGNIILDDSGSVTTGGGTANLTATSGAIQLGVVDVTNTGDIFITASGTVTDNSAALVNLIGNRGYISSGGTGPLPTLLNQFQGVTPTTGSIDLTNGQALELIAWNIPGNAVQTANNGDVAIVTTTGGITVTDDVSADGSGLIGLDASAGPGSISVLEDVSSGSGAITIIGGSVTHSVNGNLATGGGIIDVTATSGNITMNPGTSYSTGGGNALLVASNSALLNLINAGVGDINVAATTGTITNNSGANSPAILVGAQGTLTSALGSGSGTSSDATAIGTSLTQLNGSVTGGSGGIIIFEQGGLNLGNISAPAGTVDISANDLIQQTAGNILATDALFTTRAGNIGTVNVVNGSSILLEASLAAGDLTIDVGGNTLTLNGNTDVGGSYTVLAGTYDESTFTVRVGGATTTPVPINPLNTVTASGLLDDFDISSVTLASSGNITVNLRGETYNVGNHQGANAIIINSAGNTITNSLTVTTVDPNLTPQQKDYNLVNSKPITLNPMQNFIVNAAKGQNFTPGVVNPKSSPFDNSPLNGFNGSTINITNVAPTDNVFPGWVSIRDAYTTVFEAGPNLSTEYVNTYGDLTIRTTTGAIMTGATGETMRTGGALLTIESHGNLNIVGTVSNLTIPPVPQALNGIISYTSAIGSITGPALTQAAQVKLDAATGIGTGVQDLQINAPQLVFTAANDALIELSGAATVAGDSTSGAIDIETAGAGNLTIGSFIIDGLPRVGLTSAGVNGIQVVTTGGDILVDQLVTGNNGPIQLTASGAVTHGASGNLTTTGVNAINVTATSGAITMDTATVYTTGNGFASLNAHTNINVAQINVGTADIFLNSTTGGVVRVTGPPTNLIGGRGYALASSGIGASGNILQSTLSQFQGSVVGAGGIFLNDSDALQLTSWNGGTNSVQTSSGAIDIQTTSNALTVTNPVVAGGSGTIKLDANADAVVVNQTVTSNTGSIQIIGQTGVTHGMNGTVTVSSGAAGTISETATTGDISMNGNAKIITQGGNITLLADNDLNLAEVNTGATGQITATATNGMITDTTGTLFLPNFVADEVILQANTGIGSGISSPSSTTDISTVANFLTASTVSNDIVISELDGLTLRNISTGGNFFLEAGGLINQDGASTLQISGNLTVVTSRASMLGTVHIGNSANTDLGESEIAGNYTVDVTGDLSLSGDQFVGLDCNFNPTGTYTEAPFKVFHGGDYFVNGVDPDLQGAEINATGPTPNFNLDLAMPFSADPTITINLQGEIDTFSNTQLPDAIILTQAGNTIHGTIDIQTVDPMYQGTTPTNYHLIQNATPFTLNAGQTLIINAVRGTANPNVSGVLGSPFSGTVNGSNLGSNITLNLANTSDGVISIRDPNLCSLTVNGDPIFSHINTYNDLTITAPSGSITTGAFTQTVRSSGSLLKFTADQDVTLNRAVNALTTAGAPFGEIVYTANNGSISGAGPSQAVGVSFIAPLGGVTTVTQTTNCIFNAMTGVDILNSNTAGNFGGIVSGSLTITQVGAGDLRVNSVTVDGVTRTGITALDQTVNLTNNAGAITQIAGNVNAGTTGTVNLSSVTGITGIGPSATFQTLSRDVLAINSTSGEIRVENRLNGSNALSSEVRLSNGPGNAAAGRNLYFRQVGGSSVDFQTINANGTGTLLAISGSANMNFSGNVNMGDSLIAVANHNMEVGGVQFNLNTPNAVATLILDQESPTLPGSGTFVNAGMFNISSGNLAIYAASGPQAPANAVDIPPNQVVLGSLAALETWDQFLPNGLDSKYDTSYSAGGSYHGPGFGNSYTPGNGVFGSQVIWYKFNVDQLPPVPGTGGTGRIPFDPRIGINAWEVEYFLQYWDVNLNRLGGPNVPVMLVEENFETEPASYRPHRTSIDKLREKVSTQ